MLKTFTSPMLSKQDSKLVVRMLARAPADQRSLETSIHKVVKSVHAERKSISRHASKRTVRTSKRARWPYSEVLLGRCRIVRTPASLSDVWSTIRTTMVWLFLALQSHPQNSSDRSVDVGTDAKEENSSEPPGILLSQLFICESMRKKGLGAEALWHAIQYCLKSPAGCRILVVDPLDDELKSFYKKFGLYSAHGAGKKMYFDLLRYEDTMREVRRLYPTESPANQLKIFGKMETAEPPQRSLIWSMQLLWSEHLHVFTMALACHFLVLLKQFLG